MPQVQMFRVFIQQRLSAAAEEIFELFERTVSEYEETLCRQQKLLDASIKPQVHRAGIQHVSRSKGDVPPEQHEWSSRLDQDNPPELPHIKEEQEELWTGQEGPRLQGPEEADIIKFKFTPVLMKSEEHDEVKPHSSKLKYTLEAETDADRGGREPDRDFNPDSHLQPVTDDEVSRLSEPETDGSCDWEQTVQPQVRAGLNLPRNDNEYSTGKTLVGSSDFPTSFGPMQHQQEHSRIQTGEKTFKCSVCGKKYNWRKSLTTHMRSHIEGKCFSCTVCGKKYHWKASLTAHMRLHSEGKGFSCSFCQKTFPFKANFVRHMRVHTGEKPFCCSLCGKGFGDRATLRRHLRIHTGEKPFSCTVCGKSFIRLVHLKQHKCAGESSAETLTETLPQQRLRD